jgi:hypothetical protein
MMTIPTTTPGTLAHARDSKTRIPRRLAAIGALALTVLGLSVPVASAGENESIKTKGGRVTFEHKDEQITAWDLRPDGIGVEAHLEWTDAAGDIHRKEVLDADGADIPTLGSLKDLFIREGTVVKLSLCYVGLSGPIPTDCSRPQRAVA